MVKALREIYQLKVELKSVRPTVWRRFLVSNDTSLKEIHNVLQIVMGWTDSHLHQFNCNSGRYGDIDPSLDMGWDEDLKDEGKFRLKDVLKKEKEKFIYEYDFGDGWEHKVTLEKILPFNTDQELPLCIKGRRGCPPEDVGGAWGYKEFLEKWKDSSDPEHQEAREWAGEFFHPEIFNENEVNTVLREACEYA